MISARQGIDLRPQLERLDRLILRSAGVDPGALTFEFRPLWQMDAASKATIALNKAQTTQIYAGLKLWPEPVTARLVEAQLAEDGTYPGAEGIFAAGGGMAAQPVADFDPAQLRDPQGRWTAVTMTEDCVQEWADAYERCRTLLTMPNPPRSLTGGYRSLRDCAKGFVSARCGGNPV